MQHFFHSKTPIKSISIVYVYALKNKINQEIYVGISKNPFQRLKEHNSGKNRYTKAFMPWEIFFHEKHIDYSEARMREKYFKTSSGKRLLRKFLKETH